MRANPAFCAIERIKNRKPFKGLVRFHKNSKNVKYCLIDLPDHQERLTLAGKIYKQSGIPHFSIYELYKEQMNGRMSVFHFTWYGFCEENKGQENPAPEVALHVYFDGVARYVDSHVKSVKKDAVTLVLTTGEESILQRYAYAQISAFIKPILRFANSEYNKAKSSVDNLLTRMEKLNVDQSSQLLKYMTLTEQCLEKIQEKDKWSFRKKDARAYYFKKLLANKKLRKPLGPPSLVVNDSQGKNRFFKKESESVMLTSNLSGVIIENETVQGCHSTTGVEKVILNKVTECFSLSKFKAKLSKQMQEIDCDPKFSEVEKVLAKRTVIEKNQKLLLSSHANFSLEAWHYLTSQFLINHKCIQALFMDKARESDFSSVKKLSCFVEGITLECFEEILSIGDVAVCEHLLDNFNECLFYMNNILVGNSEVRHRLGVISSPLLFKAVMPVKLRSYPLEGRFSLLTLLLSKGVDPNLQGEGLFIFGTLNFVMLLRLKNMLSCVKALLQYGASVDPVGMIGIRHNLNKDSFFDMQKELSLLKRGGYHSLRSAGMMRPLHQAIIVASSDEKFIPVVELLLKHGASVLARSTGFDSIGHCACSHVHRPNFKIVNLLLKYGADIDARQYSDQSGWIHLYGGALTSLYSTCSKNDLESVKKLVNLGADPNKPVSREQTKTLMEPKFITPFQISVIKGHPKIVSFLLSQDESPVSHYNLLYAWVYYHALNHSLFTVIKGRISFYRLRETANKDVFEILAKALNDRKKSDFEKIQTLSKKAFSLGKLLFDKGSYYPAIHAFYAVIFIAESITVHTQAAFNAAVCFDKLHDFETALFFYEFCEQYANDGRIKKISKSRKECLLRTQQEKKTDSVECRPKMG